MNVDKAGRVNGISQPKKMKGCRHQRVVEYQYDDKGQATGDVVCRECQAIIPDPAKVVG